MISKKNRFILQMSLATVLLSFVFHLLNRNWNLFDEHLSHSLGITGPQYSDEFGALLNTFFLLPVLLLIASYLLFRKQDDHSAIPFLNTLILTFSSISMIAGGGGQVELHFSIFMVVAVLAYYENILLVLLMTVIFAVQHLAGYFFLTEVVFGAREYSFLMVCIHALFLVLTALATILQIRSSIGIKQSLEEAKRKEKEQAVVAIVDKLSEASRQIVQTAAELSSSAVRTTDSGKQIASAMDEIASGTEIQVHNSDESSRAIEEIAHGIIRIAESSSMVSETASKSATQAAEGNDSVLKISKQMGNIDQSVSHSDQSVQSLHGRSQEIVEMVASIKAIAGQTDLLALNAAIEASKAGDHGRGFSVVASEVRKLAEQSRGMAERITDLVQKMQEDSLGSVQSMQRVKEEVQEGLSIIHSASQSFELLLDSSKVVADHIIEISAIAEEMSAGSEQVAAAIHNMSSIANENALKTQRISAQSHEQLALIDGIHEAATLLHSLSNDLNAVMEKIKED